MCTLYFFTDMEVFQTVTTHQLGRLDVFQNAQCVKVNPDSPQKQVRFLTLSD
uniref:Uncharacterized protein n=1 Tax=Arundo donax TaxID=35708 RepID=A0A0A9HNN6_ARUDO